MAKKTSIEVLTQRFEDHLEDHKRDHDERKERQGVLDQRLDAMDGKIGAILEIKKSTEIVLRVAKWMAGTAVGAAGVLKLVHDLKKH